MVLGGALPYGTASADEVDPTPAPGATPPAEEGVTPPPASAPPAVPAPTESDALEDVPPPAAAAQVRWLKVAYSPVLLREEGDTLTHATSEEWDAAGNPAPTVVPEIEGTRYVSVARSSNVYGVLPVVDAGYHMSAADWRAAGSPTPEREPIVPGSTLQRTRTGSAIYAVTVQGIAHHLQADQWDAIGQPSDQLQIVPAIPGSYVAKTGGAASLFAVSPDGEASHLNGEEWRALGSPAPRLVPAIPGSRIVNLAGMSEIYAIAPDNTPTRLTLESWSAIGRPAPTPIAAVPFSRFVRTPESPSLWAIAPDGPTRYINASEYAALGKPPVEVVAYSSRLRDVSGGEVWASYRPGCPVGPASLHGLDVTYWGFDGQLHVGSIVVARSAVNAVDAMFRAAFNDHFAIRQVLPIEYYRGDDVASMSADNSSAFNCRTVVGNPRQLSQHSYGNALDVNPFENPYVTGSTVYPAGSNTYLNRGHVRPGMVMPGDAIHGTLSAYGWLWGGRWSLPDYQHFSSNGG